ncbi:MAG: PilZ domain-containing protein [Phycisphaerales bacterium JB038]
MSCESEQFDEVEPGGEPLSAADHSSRRRFGRMRIEHLPCSLGTVLDLSAGGLRVLTNKLSAKKLGEMVPVELNGTHRSGTFQAEVTWSERVGFRRHVVGLRFLDLTDEQRATIAAIARAYAIRMGMGA